MEDYLNFRGTEGDGKKIKKSKYRSMNVFSMIAYYSFLESIFFFQKSLINFKKNFKK
ncbi:hypothetical protein LY90DRAFT_15356 [Neocallimastix californiae]|uniref:Uncharacterized protein n=1 Tax=Neocallimastix californiae TaxID=1754190 RepID=A0A1Y2CGR3_9FUNG|nr:hypothetical protein LY90DRAFT_15356 [Neocallimastix californiae]|eukprot:ORY46219.1 hypothetical protein LY90DRAFT_15356 [Neocallimastix californiae]